MKPYSKEEAIRIIVWFQNEFVNTTNKRIRSYQLWALKEIMISVMNSETDPLTTLYLFKDKILKAVFEHNDKMFLIAYDTCESLIDLFV